MMIEKPLHAAAKAGKRCQILGLESFHGKKRNQPDHRAHLHGNVLASPHVQHVVVKAVLLIPQADSFAAHVVHGLEM